MRRGNFIWGVIIILVGVLLLLDNLHLLPPGINVWTMIWPVALILLGLWFLLGPRLYSHRAAEMQSFSIPLETARAADLTVEHGAGRLDIRAASMDTSLLSGTFGGGVESDLRRDANRVFARLHPPVDFPFVGMWGAGAHGFDWRMALSPSVEFNLTLKTGAGESTVDLTGLRVTELRVETGASSTNLVLPAAAGHTRVEIHAGVAGVEVRVPPGVAARIQTQTGLTGVNIDTTRFPRSGDLYISPDFETAANRVDLRVEAGVGSIRIS